MILESQEFFFLVEKINLPTTYLAPCKKLAVTEFCTLACTPCIFGFFRNWVKVRFEIVSRCVRSRLVRSSTKAYLGVCTYLEASLEQTIYVVCARTQVCACTKTYFTDRVWSVIRQVNVPKQTIFCLLQEGMCTYQKDQIWSVIRYVHIPKQT